MPRPQLQIATVPTVTAESSDLGYPAQGAVDQSPYWQSDTFISAGEVWIKFDFGAVVTLDRMDMSYPSSTKIASTVTLEVSDNDSDWTEVDTFTGLVAWTSQLDFTRASGRYWRLTENTLQASSWALFYCTFWDTVPYVEGDVFVESVVSQSYTGRDLYIPKADFDDLQAGDVIVFSADAYYGGGRFIDSAVDLTMDAELTHVAQLATEVSTYTGIRLVTDPATEPTSYHFVFTQFGEWALVAGVYRGIDPTTLPAIAFAYSDYLNNPNPPAEPLTTTADGQLVIQTRQVSSGSNSTIASGPPSGFDVAGFANFYGNDQVVTEQAYAVIADSGTLVDPGNWSGGVTTSQESVAISFALNALGGGGGGGQLFKASRYLGQEGRELRI